MALMIALFVVISGPAIMAWLLVLAAFFIGADAIIRGRAWVRAAGAGIAVVSAIGAAGMVFQPEIDDLMAWRRALETAAYPRVQLTEEIPRSLVIEGGSGDVALEIAESGAFDVIMRDPKREAHVEFIQSEDCVRTRRRTPRYVAPNGFIRCGHLVPGADIPATYLLLQVDPEEIVKNRSAVRAVRRLSLVEPGSTKLVDYSEVRPRLKRHIARRILTLYNSREPIPDGLHKCRIGIMREVIDTRGFLSRATGRSELVTGSQPVRPPADLLERAKTILALHNRVEAAAASWAIWAVLPTRSPERAKLGDILVAHSRMYSDELFLKGLPGERSARFCLEHGVPL